MAAINLRIDDQLKKVAYARLAELNVSPSELVRQTFEYVARTGQLPVQREIVTPDDSALLQTARERLANPGPTIRVSLEDL